MRNGLLGNKRSARGILNEFAQFERLHHRIPRRLGFSQVGRPEIEREQTLKTRSPRNAHARPRFASFGWVEECDLPPRQLEIEAPRFSNWPPRTDRALISSHAGVEESGQWEPTPVDRWEAQPRHREAAVVFGWLLVVKMDAIMIGNEDPILRVIKADRAAVGDEDLAAWPGAPSVSWVKSHSCISSRYTSSRVASTIRPAATPFFKNRSFGNQVHVSRLDE